MLDWLLKRKETPRLKPVEIGDGSLTLDLPEPFTVEEEANNTTLICQPGFEAATLRFTTFTLSDEKNADAAGLGVKSVRELAKKYNVNLLKYPEYSYFTHSGHAPKQDDPGMVYHWTIGFKNCVVIVTAWIGKGAEKERAARALLDSVEPAIKTLRESNTNRADGEIRGKDL